MNNSQNNDNKVAKGYALKALRQAAFIESCKGLPAKEVVDRANLFQGVDVSRFKVIRMLGYGKRMT